MLVTGYAEFGEEKTLWEKGRIGLCPSEALSATIASQIILIASPAPVQHGWGFCLMRDLFLALSSLKLRVYTEDLGKLRHAVKSNGSSLCIVAPITFGGQKGWPRQHAEAIQVAVGSTSAWPCVWGEGQLAAQKQQEPPCWQSLLPPWSEKRGELVWGGRLAGTAENSGPDPTPIKIIGKAPTSSGTRGSVPLLTQHIPGLQHALTQCKAHVCPTPRLIPGMGVGGGTLRLCPTCKSASWWWVVASCKFFTKIDSDL